MKRSNNAYRKPLARRVVVDVPARNTGYVKIYQSSGIPYNYHKMSGEHFIRIGGVLKANKKSPFYHPGRDIILDISNYEDKILYERLQMENQNSNASYPNSKH